jgi:ArsR family transcriptional regulator, arsenate/arsenite/antimonite-responsive transcriptional repressor / arsenate reductase (thioredoxin)
MKRRVLFVCTANSARSLMAETLLRDMAGEQFEVASAGTEPGTPHPLTIRVLEEAGYPVEDLHSKSLAELENQHWDYVITLCEKAARECTSVGKTAQQIAWDFPDPVPAGRHATFALTLKEIRERIGLFTLVHRKQTGMKPENFDPATVFKALGDELRLALLMLIREQKTLCVCELTAALDIPQPKASRHLASLREAGLLDAERHGQWVYYSLSPRLPHWLLRVLDETAYGNASMIKTQLERLAAMPDRPEVRCL